MVRAVETGWIHRAISDAAFEYQQMIESGKMPVVGLNCQQVAEEKLPMDLFEVPETLRVQEEKLRKIMKERDPDRVRYALDTIAGCCREDGNLMEVIVDSVKSYVTVGEISRTIKDCYGTWNMPLF